MSRISPMKNTKKRFDDEQHRNKDKKKNKRKHHKGSNEWI